MLMDVHENEQERKARLKFDCLQDKCVTIKGMVQLQSQKL